MLIDCDSCVAQRVACHDCVVSVLLDSPPTGGVELDETENEALGALADAGLVPPLRLVPMRPRHDGSGLSRSARPRRSA